MDLSVQMVVYSYYPVALFFEVHCAYRLWLGEFSASGTIGGRPGTARLAGFS